MSTGLWKFGREHRLAIKEGCGSERRRTVSKCHGTCRQRRARECRSDICGERDRLLQGRRIGRAAAADGNSAAVEDDPKSSIVVQDVGCAVAVEICGHNLSIVP